MPMHNTCWNNESNFWLPWSTWKNTFPSHQYFVIKAASAGIEKGKVNGLEWEISSSRVEGRRSWHFTGNGSGSGSISPFQRLKQLLLSGLGRHRSSAWFSLASWDLLRSFTLKGFRAAASCTSRATYRKLPLVLLLMPTASAPWRQTQERRLVKILSCQN